MKQKADLKEMLEKGMKSKVGWKSEGNLGEDMISIRRPSKDYVEIIYDNIDHDILKKSIGLPGYYIAKVDIKDISETGCARCPMFKECKQAILDDKELDFYSVSKNPISSVFAKPILEFLGNLIRIYATEDTLEILNEYDKLKAESQDEVRQQMVYATQGNLPRT